MRGTADAFCAASFAELEDLAAELTLPPESIAGKLYRNFNYIIARNFILNGTPFRQKIKKV